jgi:hypothetical protein
MINRTHLAVAVLALGTVFGVAACKSKLDGKKLETAIADGMKTQGMATKSVSCPADREAKKGDTFDCDAVLESGDKIKVKVEQSDDQGNVNWKTDAPPKKKDDDKKDEKADEKKDEKKDE